VGTALLLIPQIHRTTHQVGLYTECPNLLARRGGGAAVEGREDHLSLQPLSGIRLRGV